MKKLLFIFLFALIFIPARAEDLDPVIITPFYESLTCAVKPEIKNWWQGGSERVAALGGFYCVLYDESYVLDLYEAGIPSAAFLREKGNVLSIDGSLTDFSSWIGNSAYDERSILKMWLTDDDFMSFDASISLPSAYYIIDDYKWLKIEYAKKLNESTAIGGRLGLSYGYFKHIIDETNLSGYSKGGGMEFDWLVSLNWAVSGFKILGTEFGMQDAIAIGNIQKYMPYSLSYQISYISTAYNYSYTEDSGTSEIEIHDRKTDDYGIGISYVKSLCDKASNVNILIRINAAYDMRNYLRWYDFSSLTGETLDSSFNHFIFANGLLAARIKYGFLSLAVIKNVIFSMSVVKNRYDYISIEPRIEQPLIIEAAFVSDIIKVPVTLYNDNPGAYSLNTGIELTLFNWMDLRAGLKFFRSEPALITCGAGINLQNFSADVVYTGSDVLADLKYIF